MADKVYLKREWIPITFGDDEILVGESEKMREWCIDIDNRDSDKEMFVRPYDEEDNGLDQKEVEPGGLVRICLRAAFLRLHGHYDKGIKYAFPWVLYDK